MEQIKHTPGPWEIRDDDEVGQVSIVGGSKIVLATVRTATVEPGDENARLIAAAPELLEALEILVDDAHQMLYQHRKAYAMSAIAKATGK